MKLVDCREHGANAELFVVEGDSAARSVVALRNDREQAVLPLQGKPLNAWKASRAKVEASPLYRQLAGALGLSSPVAVSYTHLDVYKRQILAKRDMWPYSVVLPPPWLRITALP